MIGRAGGPDPGCAPPAPGGLDLGALLARTSRFGHGTTIGTNAVLERRGARVGLVTTAGHGDALEIMRGHGRVAGRPLEEVFAVHGTSLPAPLIVDGAVLELDERVDSSGKVVVALDERAAGERLADFVHRHALDSVAVSFLWSFLNPVHERAVEAILRRVSPDVFVSPSCQVSPRLGEYERGVATVLNGYVGPACTGYLATMSSTLGARGLGVPLLVMQSNGGVVPAPAATEIALGTIDSGPAGGLTGVADLAAALGHRHVVATDMGGTSFDIGLVIDGSPVVGDEAVIDQYTYRLPHLDVRTVACGGGTIARRDPRTGALRVGPDSAGSTRAGELLVGVDGHPRAGRLLRVGLAFAGLPLLGPEPRLVGIPQGRTGTAELLVHLSSSRPVVDICLQRHAGLHGRRVGAGAGGPAEPAGVRSLAWTPRPGRGLQDELAQGGGAAVHRARGVLLRHDAQLVPPHPQT
jgi:hypothetical protein